MDRTLAWLVNAPPRYLNTDKEGRVHYIEVSSVIILVTM
jgi:hypothetical protein